MQYELYEQILDNENKLLFYKLETNNLNAILLYMEQNVLDYKSKYIIVNNNPSYPINYLQLGFINPPTKSEHYNIIFECKLAKEYYRQIKESDFDDCYLNYEISKKLSNNIFNIAKMQTEIYFEKYNCYSND
jgi:hypothetical protein